MTASAHWLWRMRAGSLALCVLGLALVTSVCGVAPLDTQECPIDISGAPFGHAHAADVSQARASAVGGGAAFIGGAIIIPSISDGHDCLEGSELDGAAVFRSIQEALDAGAWNVTLCSGTYSGLNNTGLSLPRYVEVNGARVGTSVVKCESFGWIAPFGAYVRDVTFSECMGVAVVQHGPLTLDSVTFNASSSFDALRGSAVGGGSWIRSLAQQYEWLESVAHGMIAAGPDSSVHVSNIVRGERVCPESTIATCGERVTVADTSDGRRTCTTGGALVSTFGVVSVAVVNVSVIDDGIVVMKEAENQTDYSSLLIRNVTAQPWIHSSGVIAQTRACIYGASVYAPPKAAAFVFSDSIVDIDSATIERVRSVADGADALIHVANSAISGRSLVVASETAKDVLFSLHESSCSVSHVSLHGALLSNSQFSSITARNVNVRISSGTGDVVVASHSDVSLQNVTAEMTTGYGGALFNLAESEFSLTGASITGLQGHLVKAAYEEENNISMHSVLLLTVIEGARRFSDPYVQIDGPASLHVLFENCTWQVRTEVMRISGSTVAIIENNFRWWDGNSCCRFIDSNVTFDRCVVDLILSTSGSWTELEHTEMVMTDTVVQNSRIYILLQLSYSKVLITRSNFTNFNGAVLRTSQSTPSQVAISHSRFTNLHNNVNWGILHHNGGNATLFRCTFESVTTLSGAVAAIHSANLDVIGCTFQDCAARDGGVFYVPRVDSASSTLRIVVTDFRDLSALRGGIVLSDGPHTVSMTAVAITGVRAVTGAIAHASNSTEVILSGIMANNIKSANGGVFMQDASGSIVGSHFSDIAAKNEGGLLRLIGSLVLVVNDTTIEKADARTGGVLYAATTAWGNLSAVFHSCDIHQSRASLVGGFAALRSEDVSGSLSLGVENTTLSEAVGTLVSLVSAESRGSHIAIALGGSEILKTRSGIYSALLRGNAHLVLRAVLLQGTTGGFKATAGASVTLGSCQATSMWGSVNRRHAFEVSRGGKIVAYNSTFVDSDHVYTHAGEVRLQEVTFVGLHYGNKVRESEIPLGGCVHVDRGGSLVWSHGSAINMTTTDFGGCVYFGLQAQVRVDSVHFVQCKSRQGGAIAASFGAASMSGQVLLLSQCAFVGNVAVDGGAMALHDEDVMVLVENCSFVDNVAANSGGALVTWVIDLDIRNCTFRRNSAGIAPQHSDEHMQEAPTTVLSGGAVFGHAWSSTFAHTVFEGNIAASGGGAIGLSGCTVELRDCLVHGNEAIFGGAIYWEPFDRNLLLPDQLTHVAVVVSDSVMSNNHAQGGGVYFYRNNTASGFGFSVAERASNVTYRGNSATYGKIRSSDPHGVAVEASAEGVYPGEQTMAHAHVRDYWGQMVVGPDLEGFHYHASLRIGSSTQELDGLPLPEWQKVAIPFSVLSLEEEILLQVTIYRDEVHLVGEARVNVFPFCPVGYELSTTTGSAVSCTQCDAGMYAIGKECHDCPATGCMDTISQSRLEPAKGYWCSPPGRAELLVPCPLGDACERVICEPAEDHMSCVTQCAEHHHGTLCSECDDTYFLSGTSCRKCRGTMILLAVALSAIALWIVGSSFAMSGRRLPQVLALLGASAALWTLNVTPPWLPVFMLLVFMVVLVGVVCQKAMSQFSGSASGSLNEADVMEFLQPQIVGGDIDADGELGPLEILEDQQRISIVSTGTLESLLFYLQATKALGSGGSELTQIPEWALGLQVGNVACLFGGNAYLGVFLAKMLIPIGIAVTFASLAAVVILVEWVRRAVRSNDTSADELQVPVDAAFTKGHVPEPTVPKRVRMWQFVKPWVTKACSAALLNISILYFDVSGEILSTFSCTHDQGTGDYYLTRQPSIQCYNFGLDYTWGWLFWCSLLFGVIYIVGIPSVWAAILTSKYRSRELYSQQTVDSFGFLFGMYRSGMWLWHIVLVLRLLSLVGVAAFLNESVLFVPAMNTVMIVFVVAYDWARPYSSSVANVMASISMVVLVVAFNAVSFVGPEWSGVVWAVSVAHVGMLMAFLVAMSYPVVSSIRSYWRVRR